MGDARPVVVALTAKKITELTPVIRHLARQFEPAGKRVALDVEDLEQEGWIVAARVDQRKPDNLRQCVSRAVKNRFIDLIENPDPVEDIGEMDFEDRRSESSDLSKLEAMIGTALLSLPPRQHQIVRLYFGIGCERYECPEIAKKTGSSLRTVFRELGRARQLLARSPVLIGEWQQVFLRASP